MIKAKDLEAILDAIADKIARFGRKSLTAGEERTWCYNGPEAPRCNCGVRK